MWWLPSPGFPIRKVARWSQVNPESHGADRPESGLEKVLLPKPPLLQERPPTPSSAPLRGITVTLRAGQLLLPPVTRRSLFLFRLLSTTCF